MIGKKILLVLFANVRYLALLILPFFAVILLNIITPWNVGVSPDSFAYISTARSLKSGNGLVYTDDRGDRRLLTHFPPGTSFVYSLIPVENEQQAAKIVNMLAISVVIFLAGLLTLSSTKTLLPSLFVQLILLLQRDIVEIFSMAWSETIFLAILLLGFYMVVLALKKHSLSILLFSAILFGSSVLVRYSGLVGVGLLGLMTLLYWDGKLINKAVVAISSFIVGLLPMIGWLVYLATNPQGKDVRTFGIHLITTERIAEGILTSLSWVFPDFIVHFVERQGGLFFILSVVLYLILGISIVIFCIRRYKKLTNEYMVTVGAALFSVFYVLFLIITISFFDEITPLDFRMLSPVLVFFVIGIGSLVRKKYPLRSLPIYMIGLMILVVGAFRTFTYVDQEMLTRGMPYAHTIWTESQTMKYVKENLPADAILYTNNPELLFIVHRRKMKSLPLKYSNSNSLFPSYEQDTKKIKSDANDNTYVIYVIAPFRESIKFPGVDEIEELIEPKSRKIFNDGIVYKVK